MTNISAPINALHPEILTYVFSIVVDERPFVPNPDIFEKFSSDYEDLDYSTKQPSIGRALTLSAVSKYWRSVALSTGALWVYVSIQLSRQGVRRTLDSAPVWLNCVRTAPLNVSIGTEGFGDDSLPVIALDNPSLRLPLEGKQIRTLDLSMMTITHMTQILNSWFSDSVSDSLTHLHISVYDHPDEKPTLRNWLSRCRRLQVLCLDIDFLRYDHFPPMPNLVNLKIELFSAITTAQLTNMFRTCPNLRRLELSNIGCNTNDGGDVHNSTGGKLVPVPLHHLEVLRLELHNVLFVLPLISSASDSLCLSIDWETLDRGRNLVKHIIRFSRHCTITALRLNVNRIQPPSLRRLLCSLPQLQTLSLQYIYLDNRMALALRGLSMPGSSEETASAVYPVPRAIWLKGAEIPGEVALRLLVGVRPLEQLKLESCFLARRASVLEAKALCQYLRNSVSDLEIK